MDIRELKQKYYAKGHPVVMDGRRTELEAYEEFSNSFDDHHDPEAGFTVTLREFCDYYTNVSAVVASDDFFRDLLNGTWRLESSPAGNFKQQRPLSAYNMRPKNHGNQRFFSGKESVDNTIGQSNRYYEQRESPIRKSLAYSPPRRDGFEYKEIPG